MNAVVNYVVKADREKEAQRKEEERLKKEEERKLKEEERKREEEQKRREEEKEARMREVISISLTESFNNYAIRSPEVYRLSLPRAPNTPNCDSEERAAPSSCRGGSRPTRHSLR